MISIKNILAAIGIVLLLLAVFKLTQSHYESKLEAVNEELRTEIIRTSKLEKIKDGYYTKLVADTLKLEELTYLVDSLKVEVKNPIIVERIVVRPKDSSNEIKEVLINDSIIEFTDYYPSKEDPYIKYHASLNTFTKKYIGSFRFKKIPITVVIDEKGGLSKSSILVPEFMEVESYDFQSVKLTKTKPDNFGWLAGVGYYNRLSSIDQGVEVLGGLRYKKVYVLGSVQTNTTIGIKSLIEF